MDNSLFLPHRQSVEPNCWKKVEDIFFHNRGYFHIFESSNWYSTKCWWITVILLKTTPRFIHLLMFFSQRMHLMFLMSFFSSFMSCFGNLLSVLCTACWLRAMFEVDMRECGDGTVTLNNQCLDAVSIFLDFAYSGEILITDGNVDALFQLAAFLQVKCKPLLSFHFFVHSALCKIPVRMLSFLKWWFASSFWHLTECKWVFMVLFLCSQVSDLLRACTEFLIGSLDLSNCLSLFSIAEAYGSGPLLRSATDFAIQNFCNLSKMQDFLNMQVLLTLMLSFVHQEIIWIHLYLLVYFVCMQDYFISVHI